MNQKHRHADRQDLGEGDAARLQVFQGLGARQGGPSMPGAEIAGSEKESAVGERWPILILLRGMRVWRLPEVRLSY
ncbi:hypothetical protein TR75_09505 [Hydrogenibacillus schlegelii]|uniref:Uncharacterized protein n=1 Tax=Hydrogenibacillus schlegelii TaxID=1484 RepID=A0A132MHM2_HYDSH|nr:hypothetical protein TR75_09505 [Hydrogenibacillus schlegelii]OAR05558.1 hypothetical protein SA87_11820 [Hydrogenibacillus schlegelii]